MSVEIKLDMGNLDRLVRDLSPQSIDALVRATAFEAEGRAKTLAPEDTGYMKGEIKAVPMGGGVAIVGAGAEYSAYVELGTSRQRAQPYLKPGAQAAVNNLIAALSARLKRAQ